MVEAMESKKGDKPKKVEKPKKEAQPKKQADSNLLGLTCTKAEDFPAWLAAHSICN